ncbi:hypothetical protein [Streptomyces angustmyceticus]|uniref:hypothetical protein n=1 Tax=Streptomyces angustmyceticus TaxID=285578 RepID=UPI00344C68B4
MTAAHCVRRGSSPGTTHILMVFVPGYSKGKMPYGAFAVRRDPAQLGDGSPADDL